jgi:ClpP class serine protease
MPQRTRFWAGPRPSPAFDHAAAAPWLIGEPDLRQILRIAARRDDPEAAQAVLALARLDRLEREDARAIDATPGQRLDGTHYARVRDRVGVLPVLGPIFHRANLMTRYSGASASQLVGQDFTRLLNEPDVRAILLEVDSPGGMVSGTGELANLIHQARGRKPIWAYSPGLCCSAAYYIASAADRLVVDPSALAGSIGVVQVAPGQYADEGDVVVVSSKAPEKWLPAGTDEGRAKIQREVDALHEVFADDVARFRGVARDRVDADFGRGGVLVGASAVRAGLADRLGNFEGVIRRLASGRVAPGRADGKPPAPTRAAVYLPGRNAMPRPTASDTDTDRDDDDLFAGPPRDRRGGGEPAPPAPPAQADAAADIRRELAETRRQLAEERQAREADRTRREAEARQARRAAAGEFVESAMTAGRFDPADRDAMLAGLAQAAEDDAASPVEGFSRAAFARDLVGRLPASDKGSGRPRVDPDGEPAARGEVRIVDNGNGPGVDDMRRAVAEDSDAYVEATYGPAVAEQYRQRRRRASSPPTQTRGRRGPAQAARRPSPRPIGGPRCPR